MLRGGKVKGHTSYHAKYYKNYLTPLGGLAKMPNVFKENGVMNPEESRKLKAQTQIIKALSHPSRLFMVGELSCGERCVCELTELVGSDISTVSKHLSVLKNAGIVQDEKRGSKIIYQLIAPCIAELLQCVESIMRLNAQRQLELTGMK